MAARGNETADDKAGNARGFISGNYPAGHDSTPAGYENVKLGDLVVYRDNLMMTHAGVYDPSILQTEKKYEIDATASNVIAFDCSNTASNSGLGRSISNAVYDLSLIHI